MHALPLWHRAQLYLSEHKGTTCGHAEKRTHSHTRKTCAGKYLLRSTMPLCSREPPNFTPTGSTRLCATQRRPCGKVESFGIQFGCGGGFSRGLCTGEPPPGGSPP